MLLKTQFPARSLTTCPELWSSQQSFNVRAKEIPEYRVVWFLFVLQILHHEKPDRLEELLLLLMMMIMMTISL